MHCSETYHKSNSHVIIRKFKNSSAITIPLSLSKIVTILDLCVCACACVCVHHQSMTKLKYNLTCFKSVCKYNYNERSLTTSAISWNLLRLDL